MPDGVRLWPFAEAVIKRYIMERFRLTILAESRIRWKMYVRFGGEYWETYLGNKTRRRVLSLHNQVVKVVNAHFSNVAIPHWNSARGSWKPLSIEIQNLAKRAVERLRIQGQVPRMEGRYVTTRKRSIKMKPRCSSGRRCSNRSTNTDDWM